MVKFAKLRQLYIICVVLIQLLTNFSAEAKTPVQSKFNTPKETVHTISLPFQEEQVSDLNQLQGVNTLASKIRFQRTVPAVSGWYSQGLLMPFSTGIHTNASTPLYLPLIRFLLFPNHYFW